MLTNLEAATKLQKLGARGFDLSFKLDLNRSDGIYHSRRGCPKNEHNDARRERVPLSLIVEAPELFCTECVEKMSFKTTVLGNLIEETGLLVRALEQAYEKLDAMRKEPLSVSAITEMYDLGNYPRTIALRDGLVVHWAWQEAEKAILELESEIHERGHELIGSMTRLAEFAREDFDKPRDHESDGFVLVHEEQPQIGKYRGGLTFRRVLWLMHGGNETTEFTCVPAIYDPLYTYVNKASVKQPLSCEQLETLKTLLRDRGVYKNFKEAVRAAETL